MRISETEKNIIIDTLSQICRNAQIYLFGSRVDDSRRGGDIDLFVLPEEPISLREKLILLSRLEIKGIHRKVDLIIHEPGKPYSIIEKQAEETGILLC
jgi:uncharacterized protein